MKNKSGQVVQFQIAEMAKIQSQENHRMEAEKKLASAQVSQLKAQVAMKDNELHHDGQQEKKMKSGLETLWNNTQKLKAQDASQMYQLHNLGRQSAQADHDLLRQNHELHQESLQKSAEISELKSQITGDDHASLICFIVVLVLLSLGIIACQKLDTGLQDQLIEPWLGFRERLFPAFGEFRDRLLPESNSEVSVVIEANDKDTGAESDSDESAVIVNSANVL